MPCALLTDEPLTLRNLPRLADVDSFGHLLNQLGVSTTVEGARKGEFGRVMTFRAANIASTVAPYDIVRKMRASILVLGPLLARAGEATVSLPGGCAIGNRPIDLHLKALQALGAEIEIAAGYVKAIAPKGGLTGGTISFPTVSVGATENALMAAVLAKGTTRDRECRARARDHRSRPCLIAMGAEIEGLKSDTLTVHGKDRLHGATYAVMPDRIEAGSYACAAMITGGSLELVGAREDSMHAILSGLADAGRGRSSSRQGGIKVSADGGIRPLSLSTAPYPAFPTDMQAQFMAMLALAERHQPADRDDLRESLHARARAVADGRRHRGARPLGGGARRRRPDRRAGDGDRPARLDEPGPGRARRARARPRSTASTISTAATSGSRRNCRRSAPISSGSATAKRSSCQRRLASIRNQHGPQPALG